MDENEVNDNAENLASESNAEEDQVVKKIFMQSLKCSSGCYLRYN